MAYDKENKMSNDVRVSVIIPVYNKQEYITRCVESIVKPSNLRYEIILVDDGSKDDSYKICKVLSEKYACVKLFCQANQGVSAARNTGIDNAKGEYLAFVDADDFVTEQYWKGIEDALKNETDLYLFNYTRCYKNRKSKGHLPISPGIYDENQALCKAVAGLEICALSVWTALYKRKIIQNNNLEFQYGMKTCEDFLFNIRYWNYVSTYYISDACSYCYQLNTDSVTSKRALTHAEDYDLIYQKAKEYLINHGGEETHYCLYQQRWIRWCIDMVVNWEKQGISSDVIWNTLNNKKFYKEIINNNFVVSQKTIFEQFLLSHQMGRIARVYMGGISLVKKVLGRHQL